MCVCVCVHVCDCPFVRKTRTDNNEDNNYQLGSRLALTQTYSAYRRRYNLWCFGRLRDRCIMYCREVRFSAYLNRLTYIWISFSRFYINPVSCDLKY